MKIKIFFTTNCTFEWENSPNLEAIVRKVMYTGEHIITVGKSVFKAEVSSGCRSFLYSMVFKLFWYKNLRTWLTIRTEDICCSK